MGFLSLDRTIAFLGVAIALTLLGDSILYNVLPIYAEGLGISLAAVGILLSINRWVRLITNPVAAKVFQRFGAKKPLIVAAIVGVGVIFVYAGARGLVLFLFARIVWGLCWSHLRIGRFLVAMEKSEENLGVNLGSMNGIMRLGSAFAVFFGGYFVGSLGYRSGMLIIALIAVLAVPFMIRATYNLDDYLDRSNPKNEKLVREKDRYAGDGELSSSACSLIIFAVCLVTGLIISSLSLTLSRRIGLKLVLFGNTFGITTITGILLGVHYISYSFLSPLSGKAVDLWGSNWTYNGASLILIISLSIFALIPNPEITIITVCIIFFSAVSLETILNASVAKLTGSRRHLGQLGVYTSFRDLGAAVGPLVGYIIGVYVHFSYAYLLGVFSLLIIQICIFLGVLTNIEKRIKD